MQKDLLRWMAGTAVVLSCCPLSVHAQTVTGAVTGTVTDPSGSVIPGAAVTAHNTETGVNSTATTNGAGLYRIANLPIGRYEVTI